MKPDIVLPRGRTDLFADLDVAPGPLSPFSKEASDFCTRLSRALLVHPQRARFPEVVALGFWLRPAEIARQRDAVASRQDLRRVARGLAFHVTPRNVDTMFVYSWVVSLLAGNLNVIRLPSRASEVENILLDCAAEALAAVPEVAVRTWIVRYGHDDAINLELSRRAAVRIVWGGDATIQAFQRFPLAPRAKSLHFADRFSMALVDGRGYLALSEANKTAAAEAFYNDAYWFDQGGCSSPRLVAWVGDEPTAQEAQAEFYSRLAHELAKRSYEAHPAIAIRKLTYAAALASDGRLSDWTSSGPALARATLKSRDVPRDHCGGGLFLDLRVDCAADLAERITDHDQTLVHLAVPAPDLEALTAKLGGRGIDRIVPMGHALAFARFWDGMDLLDELTRIVHVVT